MSSVSVAIASVDPTWTWQDCWRITSHSLKWPSGQFAIGRQTRVWSIRPENIKWEIWLQFQEGPVVQHSGHGPSTSASWRRWVQGDICCAGSQGPYYTSLVQTCRDHLSRVEFIVILRKVNPDSIIKCYSQRVHPIHSSESKSWLHNSVLFSEGASDA